jgi:molybdenum cofactor cytidylyltransferase
MNACCSSDTGHIAAVVLAAGLSRRMGTPKMLLPWGTTTVIGQVVEVLQQSGLAEILVVTGGARLEVESTLAGSHVRTIFNPRFAEGEMIESLQVGLAAISDTARAALVVLGDQPQIEACVVEAVLKTFLQERRELVIPSYALRRGHPWLVGRSLWSDLLGTQPNKTMRDFMKAHESAITYLEVDRPSVLKDLDTPQDWERERPPEV